MATAKKKAPAKQAAPAKKVASSNKPKPIEPPKPPVSSANWQAQIPKIQAAIKSAEAQVNYGQAENLRGHLRSVQRLLKKALVAEGKAGVAPSRSSAGNQGGGGARGARGNSGSGGGMRGGGGGLPNRGK